jgi:hypothetical protein
MLLIISRFQGPSSSRVFGQLGGGWQVWFIGSGQVVDQVGIWLGGQFGVGSRRVLAYLTSLIFRQGGLAERIFSSGEIFGIPILILGRPGIQWLGSLHCLLWINLP